MGDGVSRETAILGVLPGPFEPFRLLEPAGAVVDPAGRGIAAVDQEISLALVVNNGLSPRVVVRRIAHFRTGEMEVMTKEQAHLTRAAGVILHDDLFYVDVFMEIHGIVAAQFQA
jgi:hypothetical protein